MNPMFIEGAELMLAGMGVVFAFLVLLVWIVGLMSRLVARLAPEPEAAPAPRAAPPAAAGSVDTRTLAVIQAAIARHRAAGR